MLKNRILLTAAGALLIRIGCAQTTSPAAAPTTTPGADTARTTPASTMAAPAGTMPMHDMADSTHGKVKMKDKRGKVKMKP